MVIGCWSMANAWADANSFVIGPTPEWVEPTPAFDSELLQSNERSRGLHHRLREFQFNGIVPGESSYYRAGEYVFVNQHGVENYSSVEISFDPSYEQLSLHELTIKRGDKLIDKLDSARFDLLRTESERTELIYDGTQTLAILLDDVRMGDSLRYAFTVSGDNPIYQGLREFRVHTEPRRALDRQYSRILTASDKPLNRRVRGADVPLVINDLGAVQEIIIDQRGVAKFTSEDDVPSWHNDRGTLVFSDMADWRSVIDWLLPMYQLPETPNPEIVTIASVLKAAHNDVDQQVGAALRWVQEEVRYFGIELGKNSHWPSRPEVTLARRFGDCKDKALLLIALLRELGIDAQPALVNTRRGLEAGNYPHRMHAFNHVIVHVMVDEQSHFIDPTRRNQSGALGDMYEPDYGLALLLSAEATGLTPMSNSRSGFRSSLVNQLTLPVVLESQSSSATSGVDSTASGSALLQVTTHRRGLLAENLRHSLETDGEKGLSKRYLGYYRDLYPSIAKKGQLEFSDESGNQMTVIEGYEITDFWLSNENVAGYQWLTAGELTEYLDLPDKTYNRKQPYRLRHPIDVEETWIVSMHESLKLDDLDAKLNNDWLSFSKKSSVNAATNEVTVVFRLSTLSNEVAADDLVDYVKSVKEIKGLASFYIADEPADEAVSHTGGEKSLAGAIHLMVLLMSAALLIRRRIEVIS